MIKQIIIQGFKSYKNQNLEDENVGRNGSGKSNFFGAIQFVLSEKYSKLKQEERQNLLHEGSGRGVMSAFVELIFDNSDSRFPTDKKEVSIRRTIGLKKDEYRIDNKAVTQKEVTNLLESAGFSSSNPYYIVEQGKVSLLTTMKDADRLNLLKEVAGTRVYDERRKESVKIMEGTKAKLDQIKEVIDSIEEKLKELEKEKQEYKEFQKIDKKKKSIEYTIYNKELEEAVNNLEQIERARQESSTNTSTLHNENMTSHEKLKEIERKIKDLNMELNDLKKQRDILSEERQEIIRNRAKIDLELKDLEGQVKNDSEEKKTLTKKLDELKKKIKETQAKIDEITPKFNQKVKDEQNVESTLSSKDRRLKELYSKAGRQLKFKTKKERDEWIKNEVKEKKALKESDEKQLEKLKNEINKLEKEIQTTGEKIAEKTKSVEEKKKLIATQNAKFNEKKEERDQLTNDRKVFWKDDNEITKKVQKTQEELDRNKKKLDSTSSTVITKGIQEMWRVVREQGLNSQKTQVYGTVIELFEVDSTYTQACEVTAGNALFNVVVESSEVASRIISIINQQKSPGRITFMPLNRLSDQEREYPQSDSFIPLIKKLKFDPKFKPVFQQIFGKTMISNNLESAGQFAKQHNLNCVTLSGDQINSKGALTGGFQDFRNSRLDTMKNIKKLNEEFNKDQRDQKKIKKSLLDIDGRVNICIGELHKLEEELNKLQNTTTQESSDVRTMTQREKSLKEMLVHQKKSFTSLELSIKNATDTINSLQKEMETDLNEKLTSSENKELQTLNEEITKLKKDQVQISSDKSELETTRNELQNQLNSFLNPKVEELKEQLDIMDISSNTSTIERKRIEQKQIQDEVDEITNKQKTLDTNIEKITELIKTESEELDKLKSQDISQTKKLSEKTNQLEKLLNKRNIWIQKKEECIKQIRELGTLPSDHEKYSELSIKILMEKLHKNNDKLKKYSHVNKKALDQYEQFSQQREEFLQKKDELDNGSASITNLIDVLDKRKDETILRTFKQVKKSFAEIFSELIPGGKATLVMNTSGNEETDSVKNSTGISILVQFSGEGEPQNMQQLSGGQKSLVALTLIFAIQRCDPAPFYLFDEIDAALDSAHRLSVAKMIKKQSESTQFIIASFKKEILDIADHYYGISFKNKVSQIKKCTKEDSLKILEEEEKEREEEEEDEEETQQETQEKTQEKKEEMDEE